MNNDFKIAVVVPCHKMPTGNWIIALYEATKGKANVFIVDDSSEQNMIAEFEKRGYRHFNVLDRQFQKLELGKAYEEFQAFQKSSSCRNFGNYMAWKFEYDIIIGLDSDCNVFDDFVDAHKEWLQMEGHGWTNPIKIKGWFSKGYPYQERDCKVIANLGLWENILDINGKDRNGKEPKTVENALTSFYEHGNLVAEGFIPFAGGNWAMWRNAIPGFLFLPDFEYKDGDNVHKFRRHDDVWGGYIFQKFMEKRNERIAYGYPMVWHDTVIDKAKDEEEEKAMIDFENTFYLAIDQIMEKITQSSYEDMMLQFSILIEKEWKNTEWDQLIKPVKFWINLFYPNE